MTTVVTSRTNKQATMRIARQRKQKLMGHFGEEKSTCPDWKQLKNMPVPQRRQRRHHHHQQ
jgi:hypothetical protein